MFFILVASFIAPKSIKYRLYNLIKLYNSLLQSIFWVFSQLRVVFASFYRKSWKNFYDYVLITCISRNFLLNRGDFRYNPYYTLVATKSSNVTNFDKEVGVGPLSNLLFLTNAPISGLFNRNVGLNLLKDFTIKSKSKSFKEHAPSANFSQYESLISFVFRISSFTGIRTNLTTNVGGKSVFLLARFTLFCLLTLSSLAASLYVLILFFYRFDVILPGFINFNLINVTFLLFSITNANLISSKDFIDFLSLVMRANYNNLSESRSSLNVQQKYFLKHESTYFLDKKCSESWVDGFYLPSEEFFYAKSFGGANDLRKSINLLEFSTNWVQNNLNSFEYDFINRP